MSAGGSSRIGRLLRNTSIATRLALVVLLVALTSLGIATIVGIQQGADLAEDGLTSRLGTLSASRGNEVESFFARLDSDVASLAASPTALAAIRQLGDAYGVLEQETPSRADEVELLDYYRTDVRPGLEEAQGRPAALSTVVPRGAAAIHLQAAYTVPGDDGLDPALVEDADDGSEWSEIHREIHPFYANVVTSSGMADLYLVDARSDVIVYSVRKEIDFATSVDVGPTSGTGFDRVVTDLEDAVGPGGVRTVDYASYYAAGGAPSLFVASPVVDGDTYVGAVVARIGVEPINELTTNGASWEGLGQTGEAYLVASSDGRLRSDLRQLVEDRAGFLDRARESGALTSEEVRLVAVHDTATAIVPAGGDIAELASGQGVALVEADDPLGDSVATSVRPVEVADLDWAMVAQVKLDELREPVADYVRNLLVIVAAFVVVLTFIAVRWAARMVEPLRVISTRLRAVRSSGRPPESSTMHESLPSRSAREFGQLADDIDTMMVRLGDRTREIEARAEERRSLLRQFLPHAVMQRAEAGDRDVLDHVDNATVVVVVFRRLGDLVRGETKEGIRDLLDRFVDEADALARDHGLERMKLSGDAYYAACGTLRPYLDHAPRTAAFALAVSAAIGDIADERSSGVGVSIGVASGSVTIGLTGGQRLVFDAWGPAVNTAGQLARAAGVDEILVAGTTVDQLPAEYASEPVDLEGAAQGSVRLVGRSRETIA